MELYKNLPTDNPLPRDPFLSARTTTIVNPLMSSGGEDNRATITTAPKLESNYFCIHVKNK